MFSSIFLYWHISFVATSVEFSHMMSVFLIAALLLATNVYPQRTCYAENDDIIAGNAFPCSPADGIHCCGEGDYCLSNGLCQNKGSPPGFCQGTCTDPTYESLSCSSLCRGSDEGGKATDVKLIFLQKVQLTCALSNFPIRPCGGLMWEQQQFLLRISCGNSGGCQLLRWT